MEAMVARLALGLALFVVTGCSSGASSSPASASGCDVSFADAQGIGDARITAAFHDKYAAVISWNPKMKYLDVLGGDVADSPKRAFEVELVGHAISTGASVPLSLGAPADPAPHLDLATSGAPKLRADAGSVIFDRADDTGIAFRIDGAHLVEIDEVGAAVAGGASVSLTVHCNLPAQVD